MFYVPEARKMIRIKDIRNPDILHQKAEFDLLAS